MDGPEIQTYFKDQTEPQLAKPILGPKGIMDSKCPLLLLLDSLKEDGWRPKNRAELTIKHRPLGQTCNPALGSHLLPITNKRDKILHFNKDV